MSENMSILCGCFSGECWSESVDDKDQIDGRPMRGKRLSYDPDFRGPIRGKSRRPKDLLCLILFVLFVIVLLAIGIYAWVNGNPQRVVYPVDSKGRLCGVHPDVRNKSNLLFFDLTRCIQIVSVAELVSGNFNASSIFTCPTPQVCVSECPTANEFGVRSNPVCVDGVDTTPFTNITSVDFTDVSSVTSAADNVAVLLDHIKNEKCAPYYIDSTAVAGRCLPIPSGLVNQTLMIFSPDQILQQLANDSNQNQFNFTDVIRNISVGDILDGTLTNQILLGLRQFVVDIYEDLVVVWPGLLVGIGVAMVLSFIYIVLIGFLAGPVVCVGIVLSLLLVTAIGAFGFYQFYCFQNTATFFGQFNSTIDALNVNVTEALVISAQICSATEPLRVFIDSSLPWFQYQEYAWLAIGIIGALLLLILIILLIVLAKRIRVSIEIMKEASKAVFGVPTSVVYPLFTFTLLLIVFAYWAVVAVYPPLHAQGVCLEYKPPSILILFLKSLTSCVSFLFTASTPSFRVASNGSVTQEEINMATGFNLTNGEDCTSSTFEPLFADTFFANTSNGIVSIACQFDRFFISDFLLGIQVYHLFGLFWLTNFVLALGECALAGGFASWYWSFKKKDTPTFALLASLGRALLFHAGSIAFGALLIAIIQLLRAILAYVQKKLKGKSGKCVQAMLCICACCLYCFEKILRYINRQAYIEIAIYGYDFCTAACKAVNLLIRNALITAVKDRIVAFLLFLGKLAITAAVGALAYVGFAGYLNLGQDLWGRPLNYYLIPVALLVVATYLIATGFTSVYHMSVDTIFICAMEDLERNNGKDKPYFMSKKLRKLLNAHNKKGDHTDGPDDVVDGELIELEGSNST